MSFNFFKNFALVKAADLEESMVNLAVALDQDGAAETAILQKSEEHSQRITMLQEASSEYRKEQQEYERELDIHTRYMAEAENIQNILNQPVRDGKFSEEELVRDLTELLNFIETHTPVLEKEKLEAEQAKVWMDEMQAAVDEISAELLQLRETVNQVKKDITQAELEKERNQKRANQAEILAGLKKSGNKFDTAINAMKQKAETEKAEAEKYKLKADSLKVTKPQVNNIVGKYSTTATTQSAESLTERLARLKSASTV